MLRGYARTLVYLIGISTGFTAGQVVDFGLQEPVEHRAVRRPVVLPWRLRTSGTGPSFLSCQRLARVAAVNVADERRVDVVAE